ncbi:MAG TPA: hypothetical protein VMW35_19065 [Myxococcota bacterium]|nr:hypothetical protein [Myxococcota bacterium]
MPETTPDAEPDAPGAGLVPADPVVLAECVVRFDPKLAASALRFARELDLALRAPAAEPATPRERESQG